MLAAIWTYDHVVATVGATAAVAAAVLAFAGNRANRRSSDAASLPRIDIGTAQLLTSRLTVSVTNSGGAASPGCFLASTDAGRVYGGVAAVPEHVAGLLLRLPRLTNITLTGGTLRRVAARDRQGTWWDLERPPTVLVGPGMGATNEEILAWWIRHLFGDQVEINL